MPDDFEWGIMTSTMTTGDCPTWFSSGRKDRRDGRADERRPETQAIVNPLGKVICGGCATSESSIIASRGAEVEVVMDMDSAGLGVFLELTAPLAHGLLVAGL